MGEFGSQKIEELFGDEPEELEALLDDIENIMEEAGLPRPDKVGVQKTALENESQWQ